MNKKEVTGIAVPLFYKSANDAIYALNVVYCATGSAEILKLCSELDLEFKSISKTIQEEANNDGKDSKN